MLKGLIPAGLFAVKALCWDQAVAMAEKGVGVVAHYVYTEGKHRFGFSFVPQKEAERHVEEHKESRKETTHS